ncbi:tRNA 2-selenouridine(34) synthase MnmH [Labilibaculum antarcticum]|uniref:tRNA 2-selenouridine(34) synthase MnmH n=1 Tax=Labilibaculum antarcticum TaxID=1717717 RepID=A0A1Y1CIM6_9BACT|nr:tRNA 2-selenouridine(34) synthase MnmH [Labilibaculum antarcticum]BAX80130.1 tRNA 2-selenouridine(34) synthase MnmH [Labilibaculum antarcticum]
MATILDPKEFLEMGKTLPMVDVRTAAEFDAGHIPGARNLPIFSNEERVVVGTKYKRAGKDSAVLLGLELVGPKLARFVGKAKKIAPEKEILIHCWRGGMRSGSMAWLFETAGFTVYLLKGGYKAYRTYNRERFADKAEIIILGGMTGSGKTEVLHEMMGMGHQVLDLEGVANHKGSVFGALGQANQPTSENFENELAQKWSEFDYSRPIWIEDESNSVGSVRINEVLFLRMRNADVVSMDIPKEERIKRLVKEYACFDIAVLKELVLKIEKRLGGLNVKNAIESLDNGDFHTVADITLTYYDKAYLHGQQKRKGQTIYSIALEKDDPKENAKAILEFYSNLKK